LVRCAAGCDRVRRARRGSHLGGGDMNEPKVNEWLRLVRKNRWDSEHLRSHVGDLGQVTTIHLAGSPNGANQVRLRFYGCDWEPNPAMIYGKRQCAHWVGIWRCDDE
jgi:hypothetical protein